MGRGNVAARNRTHEIILLSLVATSLDHSGKVCLSSVHSNASVTPTYVCVWRFQLKAETALEITGRKVMGPRNITADGRACCMLRTSSQSARLRRQRGCFSSTDLVVVQHMCCQVSIVSTRSSKSRCTRSTPSGVRGIVHLSQDVFNVEDKQGLGPNLCVGICYSLDV